MSYPEILTQEDAKLINMALNILLDGLKQGLLRVKNPEEVSLEATIEHTEHVIKKLTL